MFIPNKKAILDEIDICLGRNDLSHIDFTILHALRYLILEENFKQRNEV